MFPKCSDANIEARNHLSCCANIPIIYCDVLFRFSCFVSGSLEGRSLRAQWVRRLLRRYEYVSGAVPGPRTSVVRQA